MASAAADKNREMRFKRDFTTEDTEKNFFYAKNKRLKKRTQRKASPQINTDYRKLRKEIQNREELCLGKEQEISPTAHRGITEEK